MLKIKTVASLRCIIIKSLNVSTSLVNLFFRLKFLLKVEFHVLWQMWCNINPFYNNLKGQYPMSKFIFKGEIFIQRGIYILMPNVMLNWPFIIKSWRVGTQSVYLFSMLTFLFEEEFQFLCKSRCLTDHL